MALPERFSISLFWRTFGLLALLLLFSVLAWFQTFRTLEEEPRAVQSARQLASLVNLTRAALVHADPDLLAAVLPRFLAQGHGHISLVSSVAGYRGLPKSLAYGPTKAALIHLAEVLYLDLQPRGIGVSLVTPGFVRTPLTAQNDFAMPALMEPAQAAQALLAGWARGDFLIDFPRRFTVVLRLMRCLPYRLYFWLVRRSTGL